uniref:Holin-like toxin n=1 Tax=Bacillus subtilis subsp. natto TaxID=86029 RepID=E9RJ30_BACNA|nr:hypothetical protein [Bacillus subtilis subsp. natto]
MSTEAYQALMVFISFQSSLIGLGSLIVAVLTLKNKK